MRELRISPSQIKNWKRCPRVWAWPILGDVEREPPSGPALVGDRLHAMAEDWLRDGTPPDEEERIEFAVRVANRLRLKIEGIVAIDFDEDRDSVTQRLEQLGDI